jgi:hypothetical protein
VLYRDVWSHYTPGIYWLGAAVNLVNTSVLAFHLMLAAAVAVTALGIWLFCRRLLRAHPPVVLIQLEALPAAVSAMLNDLRYQQLPRANGEICWVAPSGKLS